MGTLTPHGSSFEREQARKIARLEAENKALLNDLYVMVHGEVCAVCMNMENRGDQFPCAYGEWCGGEHFAWRGPQKERVEGD